MKKILVAYATNSGSTAEVARFIGEELQKAGYQVDVLPVGEVQQLENYAAVVVGAPMILGWHRQALRFLRKNQGMLKQLPLAVFVTCMSLTESGEKEFRGVPVMLDEKLPSPPLVAGHLKFKERYSSISNYLRPVLNACTVNPVSIGIFGGQLNYSHMQWWAMIFVVLILQARTGDRRNWEAIRNWAGSLPALFNRDSIQK